MIVWALTGFWHGAMWNFILWGLYYGLLLLLEKLVLGTYLNQLPRVFRWLYTMFFVTVGWVLFNLTDFSTLGQALKLMFLYQPTQWVDMFAADTRLILGVLYIPLGLIASFPVLRKVGEKDTPLWLLLRNSAALVLLVVSIAMIVSSSYNPFIYFRF
jgi:alginate O-acetyltransferase complex protein AlgI